MSKKLHRSCTNKKIFGVCGGIAEHFNVDATLVRLAVALVALFTPLIGDGILLYIIIAFIIPSDKKEEEK